MRSYRSATLKAFSRLQRTLQTAVNASSTSGGKSVYEADAILDILRELLDRTLPPCEEAKSLRCKLLQVLSGYIYAPDHERTDRHVTYRDLWFGKAVESDPHFLDEPSTRPPSRILLTGVTAVSTVQQSLAISTTQQQTTSAVSSPAAPPSDSLSDAIRTLKQNWAFVLRPFEEAGPEPKPSRSKTSESAIFGSMFPPIKPSCNVQDGAFHFGDECKHARASRSADSNDEHELKQQQIRTSEAERVAYRQSLLLISMEKQVKSLQQQLDAQANVRFGGDGFCGDQSAEMYAEKCHNLELECEALREKLQVSDHAYQAMLNTCKKAHHFRVCGFLLKA